MKTKLSAISYRLSATALFSVVALSAASAQLAPTRKAPRGEALEKYDNPPALPRKIETSPRMRAASPEEREARDIRRAPRQPKPEGFLGGAAAWLTRVLGIIFREKVKKMLTRFGHNR